MTNLITAINALDADLQTDGRYAYFAPETQSTWIVTVEDMEALGAILDADEAYQASTERTRSDLLADNSHGDGYSEWCASTSCEEVREEEEEHQPEIDDDTIEQLSDEAGAAGDLAMVAICTLALDGNRQARATCAQVISDAHAMRD